MKKYINQKKNSASKVGFIAYFRKNFKFKVEFFKFINFKECTKCMHLNFKFNNKSVPIFG